MTKYSTGGSDDPDPEDESASCTMCGSTENLQRGEIAGASVVVCSSCADSGENSPSGDENEDFSEDSSNNTSQYTSGSSSSDNSDSSGYTITNPDSSWVEDDRPSYGNATTPYLVSSYDKSVREKMNQKGIDPEDVADETGLNTDTVQAVLDGNATSAGVGAEALSAIEKYLDVEIIDDT